MNKIDACFRSNKHHQINIYRDNYVYSMWQNASWFNVCDYINVLH